MDAASLEHRGEIAGPLGDARSLWASDAVVKVSPFATSRSRNPSAGYCSPTGFFQPAEEHSIDTSTRAADSAMASQNSPGAPGCIPPP